MRTITREGSRFKNNRRGNVGMMEIIDPTEGARRQKTRGDFRLDRRVVMTIEAADLINLPTHFAIVATAKNKEFTRGEKVGDVFNASPKGVERAFNQMCAAEDRPAMRISPNELIRRNCRFPQRRNDRMNRDCSPRCDLQEHVAHDFARHHAGVRDANDLSRD